MEKRLQPLRAKVRLRRAIVREAEKRCYEMGRNFRGRIRPIYARDIARRQIDGADPRPGGARV